MEKIEEIFCEVVSGLNKKNIKPIIYGSFGLYLKIGGSKKDEVNDIDFIIDNSKEFPSIREILSKIGFQTDPDHDRELIRNDFYISFIDKSEIEKMINESLKLEFVSFNSVQFFNIDILQYHKIYSEGIKDENRKNKKEEDDLNKIKEIKNFMSSLSNP